MKIKARKNFILFKKLSDAENAVKSRLIIATDDINPTLIYGQVISIGNEVSDINVGDYIYALKSNSTEINFMNEKIHSTKEEFIAAVVTN